MGKGAGGCDDRPSMAMSAVAGTAEDNDLLGAAQWTTDNELYRQAVRDGFQTLPTDGVLPLGLVLSGSRAYGCHRPDSDVDVRGVFAWDASKLFSLYRNPDSVTAEEGDVSMWELKRYLTALMQANPSMLESLYTPTIVSTPVFEEIRANRQMFLSKRLVPAYSGYAMQHLGFVQRDRGGSRGRNHLKRHKFFFNLYRIQEQALGLLENNELDYEVSDIERLNALAQQPVDQVAADLKAFDEKIQIAAARSDLPDDVDVAAVDALLVRLRQQTLQPSQ